MAAKSKNQKNVSAKVNTKTKTEKIIKCKPSEEEIRELAEILYYQRIDRGEDGSPEEDWYRAEDYLSYAESRVSL